MDKGDRQRQLLDTFFPNYADLVYRYKCGTCWGCGIFTHRNGVKFAQPAVHHQVEGQLLNSPPGPAQAEVEVLWKGTVSCSG